MANVEVIEVESSSQLNQFIDYPSKLYKDDPNYVAHLKMERKQFFDFEKNPFYKTAKVKLFLAKKDGQVCGRIATCINYQHNQFHEENVGFFGFFECPDDYEIAQLLFKVAMIHLKKEGAEKMRGPVNFSTNHECGFLVEGFDSPPSIMMTYNQPYLPKLAEKFGLRKAMDLLALKVSKEGGISPRIEKVVNRLAERSNFKIRSLNMKKFEDEVEFIRKVYNGAWQYNWGFVPMTEDEFNYTAKDLKQVVDPEIVFVVEHEGKPVAFSLALPDINQALIHLKGKLFPFGILKLLWHTKIKNKIKSVRLVTFGVIPEYQKRGLDSLLFLHTYKTGVGKGYDFAELSWILETNDLMRNSAKEMGAVPYKKYRIVEMPL